MNIFLAFFLLGIIQGLTEFLPVSSSGHLVLFSKIFGVEESLFLSILLHVATLLSIVVIFYKDIWRMITHPFSKESITLALATIPTCIIVLVLMPLVKASFMGGALPICFAITAVILMVCEKPKAKTIASTQENKDISLKTALFMGVAQGFAVFPGISRSGSTIAAGIVSGGNKSNVAKFSFLMSVPIILLSLLMEVYETCTSQAVLNINIAATMLSFVTAFLVGIFAIKVMIKLTQKSSLKWFSLYLVVLSVASLFIAL